MSTEKPVIPRLIIVDDEPVILEVMRSIFEDQPFEVVTCVNGKEAVNAMSDGGVDILLTDKNLPDINGLDLAKQARSIQDDVEVVIITGYASLDTALLAMEIGVYDYIVKPPKDVFEVRRTINRASQKQQLSRENRRLLAELQEKNESLEGALCELKEMQAELIQAEKLAGIGTLAAGVAHEISSPLFGIMGLAEACTDEDDVSLVREYAAEIVDYSKAIKEIVVELTGYSRSVDNEYHTTVNLSQTVEDAARLVLRSNRDMRDLFTFAIPANLFVLAKATELQQVFVNLLKNAAEAVLEVHSPDKGRVSVVASEYGDDDVEITISDNGNGISKDRLSQVFDPFYTTKEPGKGTGLGLNIVYRIIAKYRGHITVDSVEGEGATFTINMARQTGGGDQTPDC